MSIERPFLCIAAALTVGGCAPTIHVEPVPKVRAEAWSTGASASVPAPRRSLASVLGSPQLAALTSRALSRNADIAIAKSRVMQASALLQVARRASLPSVTASAGRSPQTSANASGALSTFAELDVGLDLDLFGQLTAKRGAALARTRAAELEMEAVQLAVESQVAAAFIQRSALAARLDILDQAIGRAAKTERIIGVRVREGAATKVDLGLQSIQRLGLQEQRSRLAEALGETRTALALLVGEEAPQFNEAPGRLSQMALPELKPPAPAALLAARPDISAAEALIDAANGDVSAARAAFFPQLNVSLSGLLQNLGGGPLGHGVSLGSSALAPIFARGALQSGFAYATATQAETVELYRQAILAALMQSEDAQEAIVRSGERAALTKELVANASLTARLADTQYIEGEQDVRYLLDAEQRLSAAEDAQVLALEEQLASRVALFRAAGGALAVK